MQLIHRHSLFNVYDHVITSPDGQIDASVVDLYATTMFFRKFERFSEVLQN